VGWLFVTFGMSTALGLVTYFVLGAASNAAEKTALVLGTVSFAAGMAGVFSLPPLVICFLAGVLLRNLPGDDKAELELVFSRLERPIYLLFLVIVGALWEMGDWRGWLLLPVFAGARLLGRLLGARAARSLPEDAQHAGLAETGDRHLVATPMGQLALAFVVTADTLYESPGVHAIVTAVIGGAVVMEIVVQVSGRRTKSSDPPSSRETKLDAPAEPSAAGAAPPTEGESAE
jgi:hypothetical protein